MKRLFNKIFQWIKAERLINKGICPNCKGTLVFRDIAFTKVWLACISCGKTY